MRMALRPRESPATGAGPPPGAETGCPTVPRVAGVAAEGPDPARTLARPAPSTGAAAGPSRRCPDPARRGPHGRVGVPPPWCSRVGFDVSLVPGTTVPAPPGPRPAPG